MQIYLNEKVIQDAMFDGGELNYGPMSYKILFVAGAKTLRPETARALEKYSKSGGKIVFIEYLPERSPSLNNSIQNDATVKLAMSKAIESKTVKLIQPPREDKLELLRWTENILNEYDVQSTLKIKQHNLDIFQNHFDYGEQKLYFFSNQNSEKTISFEAEILAGKDLVPWIWIPETGERKLFPVLENSKNISITLSPFESALIVYDEKSNAKMYVPIQSDLLQKKEIENTWDISFKHTNGETFQIKKTKLIDFGKSNDKRIKTFAGTVKYETVIVLGEDENILDLGNVSNGITELYLNDEIVDVKWYGNHLYNIKNYAKVGENKLKIIYTTVLANYMLSMKESVTAKYWTNRWKNIDGPIQQGLIGPIVIRYEIQT